MKAPTEDKTADVIAQKQISNFNNFARISLVYCQKWYMLNLIKFKWESGEVEGHTAPCQETELISDGEAFRLMRDHLKKYGVDVSLLDDQYEKIVLQENHP